LRITNAATTAAIGTTLVAALAALVFLAHRRGGPWTLPAVGVGFFISALLPVVALADHFYGYGIGIAALGMVLAGIGVCLALPRGGGVLATAMLALVPVVDRATCDRAGRDDPNVKLMLGAQRRGGELLRDLDQTARSVPAGTAILVPSSTLAYWVIRFGGADRVFFDPAIPVDFGDTPPRPGNPAPAPLIRAGRDIPAPGRDPSWDWLRHAAAAAHAAYAGDCRG
jgi:hypothetical protein